MVKIYYKIIMSNTKKGLKHTCGKPSDAASKLSVFCMARAGAFGCIGHFEVASEAVCGATARAATSQISS